MKPIVIAHLSDLHFGEETDSTKAVWENFVKYINTELKPNLILITGDIVNSPDKKLFKKAKEQIV